MYNSAFTYDYVRLTPDCQIGLHSHPRWEVSLVITGSGTRIIGDRREPITPGEVILVPPDIPHVWQFDPAVTDSDGCISNISVFIECGALERLGEILPEADALLRRIRLIDEARAYEGHTRKDITDTLYAMRTLTARARLPYMVRLLTLIAHTENSRGVGHDNTLSRTAQRLERIRTFCACNLQREISLDEIAAYTGMNRSAFCTFMRRHSGKSFTEYVNGYRLERAAERIQHTDDSISAIAYSAGFANVSYFNRLFLRKYGCSPRFFRQKALNPEAFTIADRF